MVHNYYYLLPYGWYKNNNTIHFKINFVGYFWIIQCIWTDSKRIIFFCVWFSICHYVIVLLLWGWSFFMNGGRHDVFYLDIIKSDIPSGNILTIPSLHRSNLYYFRTPWNNHYIMILSFMNIYLSSMTVVCGCYKYCTFCTSCLFKQKPNDFGSFLHRWFFGAEYSCVIHINL